MEEKKLVELAQQGDKKAFMELYNRHKKSIYLKCYSITLNKEDAKDLFQNIWLKVYIGLLRTRERIQNFKKWINTVQNNTLRDYFRNKREFIELNSVYIPVSEPKAIEKMDLKEMLKKLSKEEKYIIFLKFYEEKSIKEISQIMNLSESAVKMRIHRIIKFLKKSYE